MSEPFERMAPNNSVAFGNVCPSGVRSEPQENARRSLVRTPREDDIFAFEEPSLRLFDIGLVHNFFLSAPTD